MARDCGEFAETDQISVNETVLNNSTSSRFVGEQGIRLNEYINMLSSYQALNYQIALRNRKIKTNN